MYQGLRNGNVNMNKIIDETFLNEYSKEVATKVGNDYFKTKKYLSGQEIIRLTQSSQVNLMVIKILFDAWQEEIKKLSSNPYFDYKDYAVREALTEFINVLSRAIKIQKEDFEPLMGAAIRATIQLAVDPLGFFEEELDKADEKPNSYFQDLKKYLKWHTPLWVPVIESIDGKLSADQLKKQLNQNFIEESEQLDDAVELLQPLEGLVPIDWENLLLENSDQTQVKEEEIPSHREDKLLHEEDNRLSEEAGNSLKDAEDVIDKEENGTETENDQLQEKGEGTIDPALAWARFESEEYSFMKGSIHNLQEDLGINQRYMFTKNLFDGNPDLMNQALHELDAADSFFDAVNLLNENFVTTLNWDINSEEVKELLQLVFRKFEDR